jgi:hypothetical protein
MEANDSVDLSLCLAELLEIKAALNFYEGWKTTYKQPIIRKAFFTTQGKVQAAIDAGIEAGKAEMGVGN